MQASRAPSYRLGALAALEAESIHILREVAAQFEKPVLLYSVGKDSSVLLRLAQKAFFPGRIPFPLLHVDTGFKFAEMYAMRERVRTELGVALHVHRNEAAISGGMNPHDHGTQRCCAELKTRALLDALQAGGHDAAIGGARRDEERSRAKERIFSFRDAHGQWDPKHQRPELWNLYNGRVRPGETVRVFPLSNWTERDIWAYIEQEEIAVVPLYFAGRRPVVERNGQLIPVVAGTRLAAGEQVSERMVRFRSLGCHHCSGAVASEAATLAAIAAELAVVRQAERGTRVIDHDVDASMEQKKREGYF
ncbi:MAG TPA: sulfate adenylyltransferase subunit CysD [Burkholderiales bacterium]